MLWNMIWATAIAGIGGTGLGAAVASLCRRESRRMMGLMLGFAGGVMLGVVSFDLMTEAIDLAIGEMAGGGVLFVMGGILLGYFLVALLDYFIGNSRREGAPEKEGALPASAAAPSSLFIAGLVMASAIALHNLPEGMVIGASYAADVSMLGAGGILMAIVIGLHNIPEGMAIALPLISGGMRRAKVIILAAASGAPTLIGALFGYFLGSMGPLALTASLSLASGAMLYVVFGELIPASAEAGIGKLSGFSVLVGILVGIGILYI